MIHHNTFFKNFKTNRTQIEGSKHTKLTRSVEKSYDEKQLNVALQTTGKNAAYHSVSDA